MEHQHHQRDAAIDKTLAALRNAAPPEGMDARIAHRLQHRASAQESAFTWRNLFAGSSLTGAWWRGALAGAAAAMLAGCAVLLFQHHSQAAPQVVQNEARSAVPPAIPVAAQVKPAANPCPPGPGATQLHRAASAPRPTLLRAGTQRRPLLSEPLTAQERGLLLLVRTADPQQLAILDPAAQAKSKAQDDAEFEKFFTPPALPKTQEENE